MSRTMISVAENVAAWQRNSKETAFHVGPGPDQTDLAEDEVLIKSIFVAVNPIDWKLQKYAFLPIEYPSVFGKDVAGEVVAVGKGVTKFRPGDRIIGHCLGPSYGHAKYGAFQLFTTCRAQLVARVPDTVKLSDAVVLPLAISTAATALFDGLHLSLPKLLNPEQKFEHLLIWGASSSVGSTTVQLARAAGYEVVTTAGAQGLQAATELGAVAAFDYADPLSTNAIVEVLKNRKVVGAVDCIGTTDTMIACAQILQTLGGGLLMTVMVPPPTLPSNVKAQLINGSKPGLEPHFVASDVWGTFVPEALDAGLLKPLPSPMVIEGGLESVQSATDIVRQGVSRRKIVVRLQ